MTILLPDLKDQEQAFDGNVPLPWSDFMALRQGQRAAVTATIRHSGD
jgi:hypothetical protein